MRLCIVAGLLVLLAAGGGTGRASDRLSATLAVGFDSFSEKYSIVEADTLAYANEINSTLGVSYRAPIKGTGVLLAADEFSASTAALRNRLTLGLDLPRRQDDRLTMGNTLTLRRYFARDRDDELALPSDHIEDEAEVRYRARLTDHVTMAVRDRFDLVDYRTQTPYELDSYRNRIGGEAVIEPEPMSRLAIAYDFARQAVPDSSAIDYGEHDLLADLWQGLGYRHDLELHGELVRRSYRDETSRPGYYLFGAGGRLASRLGERWTLAPRAEIEATSVDIPSDVYYSGLLTRFGIDLAIAATPELTVGLEPRGALLRADAAAGEDYDELSVAWHGEWFRLGRAWIQGALDFGYRDYRALTTAPLDGLYSDYRFFRINTIGAIEFDERTTFNFYVSFEPERHDVESDDATIILVSTDLAYRF